MITLYIRPVRKRTSPNGKFLLDMYFFKACEGGRQNQPPLCRNIEEMESENDKENKIELQFLPALSD